MPKERRDFHCWLLRLLLGLINKFMEFPKCTLGLVTISRLCELTKQHSMSGTAGTGMWNGSGMTSTEMKRQVLECI